MKVKIDHGPKCSCKLQSKRKPGGVHQPQCSRLLWLELRDYRDRYEHIRGALLEAIGMPGAPFGVARKFIMDALGFASYTRVPPGDTVIVNEEAFKRAVWAVERESFRPGDALDAFERAKVT